MINKKISTDQVRYAVESAITLLGNAFAQILMLHHQRVLKEYNKELPTFAQGRETELLKATSEVFRPKFLCDAEGKDVKQLHRQVVGFSEALLLPPPFPCSIITL